MPRSFSDPFYPIAFECPVIAILTFAYMQGMQWPHANVFPIADILRSALALSTCADSAAIRIFLSTNLITIFSSAANVALSRKHFFGSQFISFLTATALAASAPDGTFTDNSRLTCLRCCNNFLCLRPFQVEVSLKAQEFLAPFVSSSSSAHDGVRNEWALLLRNVAFAVHSCCPSDGQAQAQYIATQVLPILLSSSASCVDVVLNATLALGTCLHTCKSTSNIVGMNSVFADQSKAALLRIKETFPSTEPAHLVAIEALKLFDES